MITIYHKTTCSTSRKVLQMIREAGFEQVTHRALTGGVANIHSGWKL